MAPVTGPRPRPTTLGSAAAPAAVTDPSQLAMALGAIEMPEGQSPLQATYPMQGQGINPEMMKMVIAAMMGGGAPAQQQTLGALLR